VQSGKQFGRMTSSSSFIKPHAVRHHQRAWAKTVFNIIFLQYENTIGSDMKTLAWVAGRVSAPPISSDRCSGYRRCRCCRTARWRRMTLKKNF
jgi:hypothetical protein